MNLTNIRSNDKGKTFLLGLGHAKCGTTWLHRHLSQNANFSGGFRKEYHIWDFLDVPLLQSRIYTWKHRFVPGMNAKRYKMQHRDGYYFDYFESLYKKGATLSGDITPTYCGLDAPRLHFIQERFAERNIAVKAIILIREPVSRIKSAVRFNLDKNNYREGVNVGETDFFRALNQYYKSEHCLLRTSYNKIISAAYEAFDKSHIYVGIYENMFEQSEVARLSQFCGVPARSEFGKVRVGATRGKTEKDLDLEAAIKNFYREVYDYCHDRFPITRQLWNR